MTHVDELFVAIREGDRAALARAITLIESRRSEDHVLRLELLELCHTDSTDSLRLAVTGAPGVGKSTLIERLGLEFIENGRKVAVLAIDPSSTRTGGSILGDKTRMTNLSKNESAFIRPSPSSGFLGGVAEMTRETILLCEAAGYNRILIETVGVGQSESSVSQLTDLVLYIAISGAGDSLQGIKRGILETIHIVAINKNDGSNERASASFAADLRNSLKLLKGSGPAVEVLLTSALTGNGVPEVAQTIESLCHRLKDDDSFQSRRLDQRRLWFDDAVNYLLEQRISSDPRLFELKTALKRQIESEGTNPYAAALSLVNAILGV